jgi:hypothetical protein
MTPGDAPPTRRRSSTIWALCLAAEDAKVHGFSIVPFGCADQLREVRRHAGSSPCLADMVCIEQNDEWLIGHGYLSAESISLVLAGPAEPTPTEIKEEMPELQAA